MLNIQLEEMLPKKFEELLWNVDSFESKMQTCTWFCPLLLCKQVLRILF
jgi:hypothetical protein